MRNSKNFFIQELVKGIKPTHKADVLPRLNLPKLHNKQRAFVESKAKRKIVLAGRQSGKTTGTCFLGLDAFLDGRRVLFVSTSQYQADIFWNYITAWLAPLLDDPGFKKNETTRVIEFNGGWLRCKTGRNADVLRGEHCDLLILDECAWLAPAAWYRVAIPMLLKSDGDAVFCTTPNRKNWIFDLWNKAESEKERKGAKSRWATWHFTSYDNPHLSREALAELIEEMPKDDYDQEILAEFLDDAGAVFHNIRESIVLDRNGKRIKDYKPYRDKFPNARFIAGLDLAQKHDFTSLMIIDVERRRLVHTFHINKISFTLLLEKIRKIVEEWGIETVFAEVNSMETFIEDMQMAGLPVEGFRTTKYSKPAIIQALQLAFERREIGIIDDPVLIGELASFEGTPGVTGMKYGAPEGMHDDTVMALAIAWYGAINGSAGIGSWSGEV